MEIREILHWLVEAVSDAHYALDRARPAAEAVHQAIDDAYGYTPPVPALSAEEQAQLDALQAKARAADQARAEQAAGVGAEPQG